LYEDAPYKFAFYYYYYYYYYYWMMRNGQLSAVLVGAEILNTTSA